MQEVASRKQLEFLSVPFAWQEFHIDSKSGNFCISALLGHTMELIEAD
jgi:hypothetical protein